VLCQRRRFRPRYGVRLGPARSPAAQNLTGTTGSGSPGD